MSRTPELIDRLVKYIEEVRQTKHRAVTIKPIGAFKECKNFYAKLDFWDSGVVVLQIKCHNIKNHFDSCGTSIFFHQIEKNDIKEIVEEALSILNWVTFSVADGRFYRLGEKLLGTEYKHLMNELWGLDEEIQCCVCNEKTITETPCGHKLCIPCWSIINETKPRCPMCRVKIDYFEKEETEDSESDN